MTTNTYTYEQVNAFESQLKDLLEKHKDLVSAAMYEGAYCIIPLREQTLYPVKPKLPAFEALQEALRSELLVVGMPEPESIEASRLLALELINRHQFQDSSGPQIEGALNVDTGAYEDNPDIMAGADEPAPEPVVVTIKVPAPEEET